jgi:hypothetical protein
MNQLQKDLNADTENKLNLMFKNNTIHKNKTIKISGKKNTFAISSSLVLNRSSPIKVFSNPS